VKRVSTRHAAREYLEAFRTVIARIERSLKTSGVALSEPVKMYVAGGAALHFYTGARISEDIDATFSAKVLLPTDLEVTYRGADGQARMLYFDHQHNDTRALMHDDADRAAIPLALDGVDAGVIEVRLLSPVDLAVSKVSRFAEHDQEDIRSLAEAGLVEAEAFRQRAEEALVAYVGEHRRIRTSIKLACDIIRKARAKKPR
jgi:uncharacterized nucleotidyltransferase DUF6036